MDKYLWNDQKGMYFDYDTVRKQTTSYVSATTFWPMWAGAASPRQGAALVLNALPKLEEIGGLASGSADSLGLTKSELTAPNRQWDHPSGWAPHQMLAWGGLKQYGYTEELQRLAYKWLHMMLTSFVDHNGVVVEKYNVTVEQAAHRVSAEYGMPCLKSFV